jgi:hypothetical protein|tara:strand:+ start:643 stop:837 length:195 start_codon:yes stop_codon:yes gene_type:complete
MQRKTILSQVDTETGEVKYFEIILKRNDKICDECKLNLEVNQFRSSHLVTDVAHIQEINPKLKE